MEIEKDFASKGVAGTALGLGAGALGVQLLNGGLGGLFGGRMGCCSEDHLVDRYTLSLEQKISEQNSMLALRDANLYQDQKTLELYKYIDGKIEGINAQLCQQAVINSQTISNLSCLTNQVAMLQGLTKTVIPTTSICPEVMPRFNSFTAPTTTAGT